MPLLMVGWRTFWDDIDLPVDRPSAGFEGVDGVVYIVSDGVDSLSTSH